MTPPTRDNSENEIAQSVIRDGYAFLPGAGVSYAAEILADVLALKDEAERQRHTRIQCPSGYFSSDGTLWNQDNPDVITHLQLTYRTSSALLRFATDPSIVRHLTSILGPNVETFGQGQCLLKPPRSSFTKHWHQDDAFFPHKHGNQVAVLMYLQDTTALNGALRVAPSSNLNGLVPHGDSQSHLDSGGAVDNNGLILEGKMGDVIVLHGLTLHASGPNDSEAWRYVALNRYREAGDYVVRTGTTVANMTDVCVPFAPAGSPIGQEGLLVAGTRVLSDSPGWAWPIWQQNQFPV